MVDVADLTWPPGVRPVEVRILAGDALREHGAVSEPGVLPEHAMRVRPVLPTWPRGEFEVLASPLTGMAAEAARATFASGLQTHGLLAWLDDSTLGVALTDSSPAWRDPAFLQLIGCVARERGRQPRAWGVGLLGFGAIGAEHARAVSGTAGLTLAGVCDPNPQRVEAAQAGTPGLRSHATPQELFDDEAIDVVIVSTPPDSHAHWAMLALESGCHVVVEKPMGLTTRDCDDILATAARLGLSALVYQNRRFDPDYELIRTSVNDGEIGEVFHLEAFIGGYSHPCNYWHSDAAVSGGALFDWGSHVIDQVLDLMPGEVEAVSAVNHKRVWHDVTNADQSRMTLHFDGGREATFVYSDIAAALKPRWYVLGTRGALTGEWRTESIVTRTAVGTMSEDILAPADSPPTIMRHSPEGDVAVLTTRPREPHPFHADLALWLSYGFEPRVRGSQSRRVVAMLEAAEESARLGGQPVRPA